MTSGHPENCTTLTDGTGHYVRSTFWTPSATLYTAHSHRHPFGTMMSKHPQADILFDGEDMQVRHYRAQSEFRLITFDIMHARASGRSAFGLRLTQKNTIDHIAIIPKYPCWYPRREAESVARIVSALKDRPTVAYGASMGGYGALRWGRQAGADSALACSPQFSIEPEILGDLDRRYRAHFNPNLHEDMSIKPEHLPKFSVAVYDPKFKPDSNHIALMRHLPGLYAIPVPYMAHSTTQCVSGSSNFITILAAILYGNLHEAREIIAKRRKTLDLRRIYLSQDCLSKGHHNIARNILEAVKFTSPLEYHMISAKIHVSVGNIPDAIKSYQEALRIRPAHPMAIRHLATLTASAMD
jgi:pimeloyl-ACP methyl ester carboxylesterase